jgi:hypothetical protein
MEAEMSNSVFLQTEFFLLILFSVVIPSGIYGFLLKRRAIARWSVLAFALILIFLSGFDVVLLGLLSAAAKATASAIDNKVFSSELSLAIYLIPAMFAGICVYLISHILINHLNEAERKFDREHAVATLYAPPA